MYSNRDTFIMFNTLLPHFPDYELIDSGNFEKLERFGRYIIRRPEPQALWRPSLSASEWDRADATFHRDAVNSERGEWKLRPGMPDRWTVEYIYKGMKLRFRLGLTSFKHVGIFPEQAANWEFIYDNCTPGCKVLNLFAYTGGASLAAKAAGADVTHVDSVKQVVSWARENMELSGLVDIRWIVDDAMKLVQRERRRGNRYAGIILDPPAYGRGPDGEKWILEEHLTPMLEACAELLNSENSFLVLNLYSMGLSATLAQTAVNQTFGATSKDAVGGELCFDDRSGKRLPLGTYYRFQR